jgi:hypothetical protein
VTLVGVTVHEVLLVVRATVPLKPFCAATVIVEVPAALTFTVTLVGLALTVKSVTVKVTVTECDRLPLVPVTVTWMVAAAAKLQDRLEVPDPVTLVGVNVHEVLLLARLTTPANPWSAPIVIVEEPAEPARTVMLVGLALMVKSWTVKVTVAE